ALGFAIPILLVRHVVATRISEDWFGTHYLYYRFLLWNFFVHSPQRGVWQLATLVVAWSHAMIGLHFWLRVRPWYARMQPAALVPRGWVRALWVLGAIEPARHVAALAAADPLWANRAFADLRLPLPTAARAMERIDDLLTWFFSGIIVAVLLARLGRSLWR